MAKAAIRKEPRRRDRSKPRADNGAESASRRMAERILRDSGSCFWSTRIGGDGSRTVEFVSDGWKEIWGFDAEDLYANPGLWMERVVPEDREIAARGMEQALTSSRSVTVQYRIFNRGGDLRWIEDTFTPVEPANNGDMLVDGFARDITGRMRLNAQLQQAQKLETIGILAGGIAHDFNNLLMGIGGFASLTKQRVGSDETSRSNLEQIEVSVSRAAGLCRQLMAYAGKGRFTIQPLDLSRQVREMAAVLRSRVGDHTTLSFDLPEGLPPIEGDPTQISQTILNIITNAAEAHGETPGNIHLCTGVRWADREFLASTYLDEGLPEGEYVYFEISDTGVGMTEDTVHRIFDPFFSTKFAGRGLGMAAVLGIVRGHRGAIEISSTPGKGTAVRVLYPSAGPIEASESVEALEAVADRPLSGHVLVVDDDPAVRRIARKILEGAGLEVSTAENGYDALDVFREDPERISLVLLDATMPGMNGAETFYKLTRMRPDVRVLMSSGYDQEQAIQQLRGTSLAGFLQKPYRPEQLLARVGDLL